MRTMQGKWMNWLRLSPQKRLEWYPPFRSMRIKVLELDIDQRTTRILLPLNRRNSNPGGCMFGGCMASLADPVPALVCARVFPGYGVWTRKLGLDFRREARQDMELRFHMTAEQVQVITNELAARGRSNPDFEYGFYQRDGRLCALVHNTVAIRTLGPDRRSDALRNQTIKPKRLYT